MTTKPDKVVEALENAEAFFTKYEPKGCGSVWRGIQDAIPLALEQAEAKEALEWLLTDYFGSTDIWVLRNRSDCPAIIKRLIEEKT